MTTLDWERLVPPWLHNSKLQGILIVDVALTIRFWSHWLEHASGKSASEVIGQPLVALFPELEQRGLVEAFNAALNGEERLLMQREHGYVLALPPPNGITEFSQMQQRVRLSPVYDENQIIGVVALIDDVTDRACSDRAAACALREQQEATALLETLLANAPIGFAFVDRDLRYRHVNERLARLNNLPAADHIGHTFAELFPQWGELVMPLYETVLHSGEPLIDHELSARSPDNTAIQHLRISHFPVRWADGTLIGLGSLVLEATEQKRTEAASRLLDQFGAVISETFTTPASLQQVAQLTIPTLGTCCLIELIDEAQAHQYFAASEPTLDAGQVLMPLLQVAHERPMLISDLTQATPADSLALSAEVLSTLAAQGMRGVLAVPLRNRGRLVGVMACGSTHVYTSADLGLAGELGRRLAQVIDNLGLYQAEQSARAAAEHAVQVRDEFFSIAAHELRTPLTTMLGRIQLLERRMNRAGTADERDLRAVQTINEQAQRLNRMISALLNVSQIEMGQLQLNLAILSLRDLTRRIVEEHRLALDKHTVTFIAPDDPVEIMGDEMRLDQVLQNLLNNATKYSPNGGQITVALTYTNRVARVAVIDRGIGIPANELPRLFRRFYRAEHGDGQHFAGMGIGLYVVREVVERHGGCVLVESVAGQGSTFTVELPRDTAALNP